MGHVSMDRWMPWLWGAAAAFGWFAGIAEAGSSLPQMVNFSVAPSSVDSSAGPSSLTISITAQDPGAGFESNSAGNGVITLSLASGATVISHQGLPITGGTATNPVFQFPLTVPQYTPAGVYAISLTLTDTASNTATFSAGTLQSLGFPSSITVTESAFGSLTLSASTANLAASGGAGSVQAIASNSGFAWTATSNASWLTIISGASGTGTGTITYFASANSSSSQRTGIISVSGQTFTVIQSAALSSLNTTGGSLAFTYQIGGATPPAQTITAYSSGGPLNFSATATSAGNWLFVSPANGVTSAALSVFINPVGLAAGTYSGSVTVSSTASANGSQTEVVTLTVSGGAVVAVTPNALSFSYQQGGSAAPAQSLSIAAGAATGFSASASSVGGWLAVNPANSTTPTTLTVSVSPANLAPGTYNGSVGISTAGGNQAIAVTLVVAAAPSLAVNPSALTFSGAAGAMSLPVQTLSLSGPASGLTYTASASSTGNWLIVGASSGTTPGGLAVSVSPAGLAAGQYSGSITLTPATGAAQVVPVTLILSGQNLTVAPVSLTFNVQLGTGSSSAQLLTLTASTPNETLIAGSSVLDGPQGWLLVSPTGAFTSGSVSVAVNAAQLTVGTHMGLVTITGPSATLNIPVTVFVNAPFTTAPASLAFAYQLGGIAPATQTVAVTGSSALLTFSATASSTGSWLSVSSSNASTPASLTIAVNPAGLTAGAYSGTISLLASGSSSTIPVTLTVSSSATTSAFAVSPTVWQVNYQVGDPGSSTAISLTGSAVSFTAIASSSGNWLAVSPASGTAPATLSALISPSSLAPGQYTGTIQIAPAGGAAQTVMVSLNVYAAQNLTLSPSSLAFAYQTGGSAPPAQIVTVGCPNSALSFRPAATSVGNWLVAATPGAQNNTQIIVSVSPAGLVAGTYQGAVTIVGVGACNTTQTVPVSLTVSSAGSLTAPQPVTAAGLAFSVATLSFTASAGGTVPASQTVSLTCSSGAAAFTAVGSSNQVWLSVSPLSGTTPAALTVVANPAGLGAGSYTGSISATSSACGYAPAVTVTLTVSAGSATAGALTITPASLAFNYQAGAANPASQPLSLAGQAGAAFTASSSTGWLSVSPLTGAAPAVLTVSVNATSLLTGTYTGAILISIGAGTAATTQNVAVTITVTGSAISAPAASPIAFTYQLGDPPPPAQSLPISGGIAGTAFAAVAASPSNWLSISPASGTLPATLIVSVNPVGLAAGSYAGVVTVTPASGSGTIETVPITLQITALAQITGPVPFLNSILNGASLLVASVAPGEIISIFGQGLGPAAGLGLALTPAGLVANSLGGVRLLFDGVPAPLIYVQQGQVNAVVPYSVAGATTVGVRLEYQGVPSAPSSILVALAAPAIFTVDQSGQGQGAILNQDTSVNSDLNPADQGSIVTLYASGAGLLTPAGQDGAVTTDLGGTAQPVSVLVDGQNTEILYAGPAPELVSGALQVNFRLPQQITVGKAVGLLLKAGRFTSQPGVTISIR